MAPQHLMDSSTFSFSIVSSSDGSNCLYPPYLCQTYRRSGCLVHFESLWYYNESTGVMPGLTREKVNRERVAIQHWEKTVEPESPESSHKDQFLEQQL